MLFRDGDVAGLQQHGVGLVGHFHHFGGGGQAVVVHADPGIGLRALPVAQQLLQVGFQGLGVDVAHDRELAVGGASEVLPELRQPFGVLGLHVFVRLSTSSRRLSQSVSVIIKYFMDSHISFWLVFRFYCFRRQT